MVTDKCPKCPKCPTGLNPNGPISLNTLFACPSILLSFSAPTYPIYPISTQKYNIFFALTQPVKIGWLLCIVKQVITD